MLHLLKKAKTHAERVAIQSDGKEFTYGYLDERSDEIASFLLGNESDLNEENRASRASRYPLCCGSLGDMEIGSNRSSTKPFSKRVGA